MQIPVLATVDGVEMFVRLYVCISWLSKTIA